MPLGKYYCDYCHKEFQDTPAARKRHLQGVSHLRAKAQWFHSFNDPNQAFFSDPFSKGVCNRVVKTGFCPYGESCKYFHPTNNQAQPPPGNTVRASVEVLGGNLPPSLMPPPEGGYPPLPFIDWA